jgi:hypothetical protein
MSKTPTFNSLFTKYFTIERYTDAIVEAKDELMDAELVQKIIMPDMPEFIDSLTEKALKAQVNKYGFFKACCEFNGNKHNKSRYLLQATGSKLKYSEELELATYKTLLEHVIFNTPVLMTKLVKAFAKVQSALTKKSKSKGKSKVKPVVQLDIDEEKIDYTLSDEDDA